MELEIDYSAVPQTHVVTSQEDWEPPVHKFFGKKDPQTGKMEKEPTYYHQEYPRLMYNKIDDKIVARLVRDEKEKIALGEGWETTAAKFGYLSCPSFEEHLEIMAAKSGQAEEAPRVGRSKKVA
jgi:hypothetical protein